MPFDPLQITYPDGIEPIEPDHMMMAPVGTVVPVAVLDGIPYRLSYVAMTTLLESARINLYDVPEESQISCGGRPSVPNTIGLVLAVPAVESVYVAVGVLEPAT